MFRKFPRRAQSSFNEILLGVGLFTLMVTGLAFLGKSTTAHTLAAIFALCSTVCFGAYAKRVVSGSVLTLAVFAALVALFNTGKIFALLP